MTAQEEGGTSGTIGGPVDWSEQVEFLRGLAAIVRDEELSELLIEQDGVRLSLRSRRPSIMPPGVTSAPALAPLAVGAPEMEQALEVLEASPQVLEEVGTPIVSPMVGVFYRSKTPDDPPFIEVGDRIEVGAVVGLVEAMKTFNEITSEVEGEVVSIPTPNNALVETGATLVVVR